MKNALHLGKRERNSSHWGPTRLGSIDALVAPGEGTVAYLGESALDFGLGSRLFEERRKQLGDFLRQIEGTVGPLAGGPDPRMSRLQPVVANEVARLRERLETLPDGQGQPWAALAELERLTQLLASETLAVVGGISMRVRGLDSEAGELPEALLAAVAGSMALGYEFITVPSGSEFIDVMSDVIRVRYPGAGVWDLPVVLHEFGHFLVGHLPRSAEPSVSAIIDRERSASPRRGYFADELWADTFAAYVGGPAYAFSAMARFDVVGAAEDALPSHPSAMKRVAAIRLTLGHSQTAWQRRRRAAGSLEVPIASAEDLWRNRLRAAGVATEPDATDRTYAEELAGQFIGILDRDWPRIRYDDTRRAAAIRQGLDDGQPELPRDAGLIDVLNGGWWARRNAEAEFGDADVITEQVSHMCREIMADE